MCWATDVPRRAAGIVLALLLGAAGCLSVAGAAVAAAPPQQVHTHGYDAAVRVEPLTHTAAERGPPESGNAPTYSAVDHWSNGAAACSERCASRAMYDYDAPAGLVHGAWATGTTTARARLMDGDVLPVRRVGVAAKSVDELADVGHSGLRHQFPNTLPRKSQFFDDIDLGGLASRTKGMDGFLQTNGNTRYVLRNPGGVGVDRTTGLPTDAFTVIRRPDGSVVTMFPGTSPKG